MHRLCVLSLAITISTAQAASPDDVGMALRIESTTDPQFRIGTQAVLAFDIVRYGPLQSGDYAISADESTYLGGRRILLSPVPDAACDLIDVMDITTPPIMAYTLQGHSFSIGQFVTCRVRLVVVDTPVDHAFRFHLFGTQDGGSDPDPANNEIVLPIGNGASPRSVPALSLGAASALSMALAIAARLARRVRQRPVPCRRSSPPQ